MQQAEEFARALRDHCEHRAPESWQQVGVDERRSAPQVRLGALGAAREQWRDCGARTGAALEPRGALVVDEQRGAERGPIARTRLRWSRAAEDECGR